VKKRSAAEYGGHRSACHYVRAMEKRSAAEYGGG
jgi:hypothetical protein